MKLVRFGALGREKPGLLDADGNIRDLSGLVPTLRAMRSAPRASRVLRPSIPHRCRWCLPANVSAHASEMWETSSPSA